MSNYQSSFHVINLKLDIEPSLLHSRCSACSATSMAAACYPGHCRGAWMCSGA